MGFRVGLSLEARKARLRQKFEDYGTEVPEMLRADPVAEILEITDTSRLAPAEVPSDVKHFRAWADFACVEWPSQLMIQAYRAWEHLSGIPWSDPAPRSEYEKFLRDYASWFGLSEGNKELQMSEEQRDNPSRAVRRRQALDASRVR